jgi:SAM-dependent methyltransferase
MLATFLHEAVNGKKGLEIGGPSSSGYADIYKYAALIDNVIFSNNTIWSTHGKEYHYIDNTRIGKVIINDATELTTIDTASYDFLFASHSLEHIANPIKALKEWIRVIKHGGTIILILPEKSRTFDHRRNISLLSTLKLQYEKNVGEDDLSTLDEILKLHDLSLDTPAGTPEQFKQRSLKNIENRCLHHYVYSPELLQELCTFLNCIYIYTVTNGMDIWFIMKTPDYPLQT